MLAETINSIPWEPHPEVWFLLVASLGIGVYVHRVLEPNAVKSGLPPIKRSQKVWYVAAVLAMWLTSDWPMHDLGDEYLYSAHMLQHLLLSMIIPAMFMISIPRWIFELIIPPESKAWAWLTRLVRPVPIFLIYNAITATIHWSRVVQASYDSGAFHFGYHAVVFTSGLLLWLPINGPVSEWRMSPFGSCIFLFSMSIIPTVPGGWLVFAEGVVYQHYDTPDRLFGISALADQQAAGAVMKIVGGFFMWSVIAVIYGRYARDEAKKNRLKRSKRDKERLATLTYDDVAEAFEATPTTLIEP